MSNIVYITCSLDGYIADKDGSLAWLYETPNPAGDDLGFVDFMTRIDALVMGRNTFEAVMGFDCEWPYEKPVFVLSSSMTVVPEGYADKIYLLKGSLPDILNHIHEQGYNQLYIDGGINIQNVLKEDLIDELIITQVQRRLELALLDLRH